MDNDEFPFEGESPTNDELGKDARELRARMAQVQKKLNGEIDEPVTNEDILQFLRVVNYNFLSLTRLLQSILLKTAEIDAAVVNLTMDTTRIGTRLHHFFEMNSMLDEVTEDEDFNVSGSATGSGIIF